MISPKPIDRCAETIINEDKVKQAQQALLDGLSATHLAATFKALCAAAAPREFDHAWYDPKRRVAPTAADA